jgi:hypothetical protein
MNETIEKQARERISNNDELNSRYTEIFDYELCNNPHDWEEHMEWLATAPIAEIVSWAAEL